MATERSKNGVLDRHENVVVEISEQRSNAHPIKIHVNHIPQVTQRAMEVPDLHLHLPSQPNLSVSLEVLKLSNAWPAWIA